MPQAIGAAVADYFAFNIIGTTVAGAAFVQSAVTVAVGVALNQVAAKALGGRARTPALDPRTLSATIRQASAPRRLVYGEVKVGGILNYAAQSSDGQYAYLCIVLGEGPMEGIDPVIWIGDERSDAAKFAGLVDVDFFDGTQTTASATLIAAGGGEWTAQDVGNGIAYLVVRYKFDRNAFPQGLVLPAVLAKGRKVFDPRTSATAHTRNPALIGLDYVRSAYGYQAADDEIDWDSFIAAANICDEIIDSIDPANTVNGVAGKVRRYTFDGVIETDVGPAASLAAIEQAMAGQIRHINGKWRAYAGAWRAPTGPTLTGEFLTAPPVFRAHPGRQQRINIARGTYREPKADWQDADYREQTLPASVAAEGEIVQAINFPGTIVGATAQRLAKLNMMLARRRVPLVLKCNYAALLWQELDVVTVSLPLMGISGDYVIDSYVYNADGGISMTLFPHVASDYAWTAATDETMVPEVIKPSFNSTPAEPINLTVSGAFSNDSGAMDYARPSLAASWTAGADSLRKHFELQWGPAGSYTGTHIEAATSWRTFAVAIDQAYDVRVRAVRFDDTTSDWVEVLNTTVQDDQTPPGPPTALSVTAGVVGGAPNTINWTTPGDFDLLRSRVYASTTNNPATATQIAEIFGLPSTAYSTTHPRAATPNFYWVESVDRIGNTSARTYAGTA